HDAANGVRFLTGDLATGQGIDAAVAGVVAVVHCASSAKGDAEATRNLVQAASRTGKPHLVYVSIVGSATICGPAIGAAGSCRSGYRAPARSGPAVSCRPPVTSWATGRGNSSWPGVCTDGQAKRVTTGGATGAPSHPPGAATPGVEGPARHDDWQCLLQGKA